ncbi:hypothetical protein EUTSA_v10012281mg [Eutrema salsugineum]|uniref:F-box associated beta-propeller type 3 domain-containing protein n=1 Tax=Eutrema salsugineum TaxID=72664 RepID=V4KKF1_EUTSA|nr:hypothetical protein EUTSA_v10012281mg [Eutrema salsugineum]
MLIPYEGRLAYVLINQHNVDGGIILWILEDAEIHDYDWTFKHFLAPFQHYDPSLKAHFHFNGNTHAREFRYVPLGFYKYFYILFNDPEKNSFRKVEFKGVGDGRIYPLHTFQNHIETLKSL